MRALAVGTQNNFETKTKQEHDMRHAKVSISCLLALSLTLVTTACGNKTKGLNAASEAVNEKEDIAASDIAIETAPPGEPGPFLIQLTENFPTEVFGAAATASHFAIATQTDTRNIANCPLTDLAICFRGIAYVSPKSNPTNPRPLVLYESDTQSGSQVDDLVASKMSFVFAVNEGAYVGDTRQAKLVVADLNGSSDFQIPLNPPDGIILQTRIDASKDNKILACHIVADIVDDIIRDAKTITCESIDIHSTPTKRSKISDYRFSTPVRAIDLASSQDQALVAWIAGGRAYAASLNAPRQLIELGAATALNPIVAKGHGVFIIAWQAEDSLIHLTSVDKDMKNVKTIKLNGIENRSLGGITSNKDGFLTSFRHENTQQLAHIAPDLSEWQLIDNSKHWRMFSNAASLDLQDAHNGSIIWQTAYSLVKAKD